MSTTLDLDHAATAPVRRSALEAMWPALTGVYGNPSSAHEAGRAAAALLEDARARVACAIGARAGQVPQASSAGLASPGVAGCHASGSARQGGSTPSRATASARRAGAARAARAPMAG